jgi:preprotein translocase subunit SecF
VLRLKQLILALLAPLPQGRAGRLPVRAAGRLGRDRGGRSSSISLRGERMALTTTRNAGMLVLAIYLIVIGLTALVRLPIPLALTAVLALLAGVLILLGR